MEIQILGYWYSDPHFNLDKPGKESSETTRTLTCTTSASPETGSRTRTVSEVKSDAGDLNQYTCQVGFQ